MGLVCNPACRYWIYLSKDKAICDCLERRTPNGKRLGLLEGEYCDHTPTTNGDYYDTWTHPTVYTRMMVMVKDYDSYGHWLGSDYHTSGINPGGGGGGDPPPI